MKKLIALCILLTSLLPAAAFTDHAPPNSIARFYRAFLSEPVLESRRSVFLLPSTPTAAELTVAAAAAAGLSSAADGYYQGISLLQDDGWGGLPAESYCLCISELSTLPGEVKPLLKGEALRQAEDGALITLLRWEGRDILLLTGTGEAFLQTGRAMANPALMGSLDSTFYPIYADGDYLTAPYEPSQYLSLTDEERVVRGPYLQELNFSLDTPHNRGGSSSNALAIAFRYSPDLDFERSLVTIFVNGVPVGSKTLSALGAAGETLELPIPKDAGVAGSFSVRVSFYLAPGDALEEQLWAAVEADSLVKLSGTDRADYSLSYYPSPFLRDGRADELVFLLPDRPSGGDVEAMHRVALGLGRFLKDNRGKLRAAFFGRPGALEGANLIAIGTAAENHVLQDRLRSLPLRLTPGGGFLSAGQGLYAPREGVGLLLPSPYGAGRGLLVVSGKSTQAVLDAARLLEDAERLQLSGDAFTVEDGGFRSFLLGLDTTPRSIPAASRQAEESPFSPLLPAAAGAAALLLLAAGMLARRYGGR